MKKEFNARNKYFHTFREPSCVSTALKWGEKSNLKGWKVMKFSTTSGNQRSVLKWYNAK